MSADPLQLVDNVPAEATFDPSSLLSDILFPETTAPTSERDAADAAAAAALEAAKQQALAEELAEEEQAMFDAGAAIEQSEQNADLPVDFSDGMTIVDGVMTDPGSNPEMQDIFNGAIPGTDSSDGSMVSPTWSPTVFDPNHPTYRPTATYPPSASLSTKAPTFFPSYYTYPPTDGKQEIPTPPKVEVAPGAPQVPATAPTQKPSFEDSNQDSYSLTKDEFYDNPPVAAPTLPPVAAPTLPPAPVPAPTVPPKTRPPSMPTAQPTMQNNLEAGVKGAFRRKEVGFQSSWGPTHAGSMIYDFTRNSIYVTGTTIPNAGETSFDKSRCFVGELPIADIESWKTVDEPKPTVPIDVASGKGAMGCHMISFDDASETDENLYVGGVYEQDATDRRGGTDAFLDVYQRSRNTPDWKLKEDKTTDLTDGGVVTHPVAMANGKFLRQDSVFVISVGSDDGLLTEEYIENGDANNARNRRDAFLPPGAFGGDPSKFAVPKRGSSYFLTYHQYLLDKKGLQFKKTEQIKPPVKSNSNIYPTGILNMEAVNLEYMIVGHVQGEGPPQMHLDMPLDEETGEFHMNDTDGFMARFFFPRNRAMFDPKTNMRFSSVETQPALDDFVHGICPGPVEADGTIQEHYVVGSTYGTMPPGKKQKRTTTNIVSDGIVTDGNQVNRLAAWVTKMKGDTTIWTTQLYAINPRWTLDNAKTEALGCHLIDSSPDHMYIAGTVYEGGLMDSTQASHGESDVWVAKLATDDGSLLWIRQIGSSYSETLSRHNGIEVDVNGHAIVYGTTTGEMYRKKQTWESIGTVDGSSSDVFVTTLDYISGASEMTVEIASSKSKGGMIGGLTVAVLIVIAIGCFFGLRPRKRKGVSRPREDENLNEAFEDEDDDMGEEGILVGGNGYDDDDGSGHAAAPPKEAFSDNPEAKLV